MSAGPERALALEHIETGALAGCCGVKSTIGETPRPPSPRVITEANRPRQPTAFDMRVLIGVNDFTGCSEGLAVRAPGASRARHRPRRGAEPLYAHGDGPNRFRDQVVSELRGVVSPEGVSPFWGGRGPALLPGWIFMVGGRQASATMTTSSSSI